MSRLSCWEQCNIIYSYLLTLLSPLMRIRPFIHTSNAHISRYVYRSASFISQLAITVEYYVSIKPDNHDKTDKMLKQNIKLNIPHCANISKSYRKSYMQRSTRYPQRIYMTDHFTGLAQSLQLNAAESNQFGGSIPPLLVK